MAKEKIGSNAIFSGPQQGITIAKEFFYGYSGAIDLNNTTTTLFSFHTGKYVSVGQFQMVFDKTAFNTGESLGYTVKFNNNIVARLELEAAATTTESVQDPVDLIIPPMTSVLITGDTDGGSIVATGILTGRVYA
jgi:hypothetical protein